MHAYTFVERDMIREQQKLGLKVINKDGEQLKVIGYKNNKKFWILFEDGKIIKCNSWVQFINGEIVRKRNSKTFIKKEHPLAIKHRELMYCCYHKKHRRYPEFAKRGITVCEEWHTLEGFHKGLSKVWGFHFILNNINTGIYLLYGKTEYSSENCILVPNPVAHILNKNPKRVTYYRFNKNWRLQFKLDDKYYQYYTKTEDEAYQLLKEKFGKMFLEHYKNKEYLPSWFGLKHIQQICERDREKNEKIINC